MTGEGIEYTLDCFKNADNTTRILSIWDQADVSGTAPESFGYGSEYSQKQINRALERENPYEHVPSIDEDGHGTYLASVAAGNSPDFQGAAPLSNLVVVKLKEAKPHLKQFFRINEEAKAYQENDIILAMKYINEIAIKLQRPVVYLLGLGSSSGPHDGTGPLNDYISSLSNQLSNVVVVAAGNEGAARHHYQGNANDEVTGKVEINVGEEETGFSMELWGEPYGIYQVTITSPLGKRDGPFALNAISGDIVRYALENTVVNIDYSIIGAATERPVILIRFQNPTPGIWMIEVESQYNTSSEFNIWLPITQFLSGDTYFLRPNPDVTLTDPGSNKDAIVVSGYNHENDSFYLRSSRGFTLDERIKPDFAAPAVDISGINRNGDVVMRSGTSAAAAITAGAVALFLQWAIVEGNVTYITASRVRADFIRGARKPENVELPSQLFGWGFLDLYRVFEVLLF
ncbi:MAG: S8 family peptidase [Lachnospiraceae bacterium]|nr:S8 family peptidase [Lachnospiraceae bacterium]